MHAKIIIPTLILGVVALGGCAGGDDSSALPDCRSYRAAISRAYADPESTVIPSGLTEDDARDLTTDREAFQSNLAEHTRRIASQRAAADQARAAVATGSKDLGDQLVAMPVTDDTAQYRQTQRAKWQAYVDAEIPRILSRQGCSS